MSCQDPARARSLDPISHDRFRIDLKEWDSEFFERPIGLLTWEGGPVLSESRTADRNALLELCADADNSGYELTECHVDLSDFAMVSCVEDAGFRLVDSRIRFLTRWDLRDVEVVEPRWGRIRAATIEDRARIIELTHEGFTYNREFVSRFKDPDYYSETDARRYFEAWIDSTAFADDGVTAVFEVDGDVIGYFIYLVRGSHDGLAVVKGVLTAVAPEHRGANAHLAMQSFLYRQLDLAECYLDNVTQLSNTPVIRNHVRHGKRLEQTALTFYRRRSRTDGVTA